MSRTAVPGIDRGGRVTRVPDGGQGAPLDSASRAFMEGRFGHDFGQVRVHTGGAAGTAATGVHALAYTIGSHIVFGDRQYDPGTIAGQRLLAHELAHVVQQSPARQPATGAQVEVSRPDDALERDADVAATAVLAGSRPRIQGGSAPAMHRQTRGPYISQVSVNLTPPESAKLSWSGTPPQSPGGDSFTVSTGKGYSNPEDDPGTCTRGCCGDPDRQCAPPYDQPGSVGSCCTPVGNGFWTGVPRESHNGWSWWTPVEPVHTSGGRGIALHQHTEVTGQAIGHGCIRMDEPNAHRIFLYSRGRATNVTITGRARVDCPGPRRCGATTELETVPGGDRFAAAPGREAGPPGPGGVAADVEPQIETGEGGQRA